MAADDEALAGAGRRSARWRPTGAPPCGILVTRRRTGTRYAEHLGASGIKAASTTRAAAPSARLRGSPLSRMHLPAADLIAREALSLPMGPQLTEDQQERVIEAVRTFRP